MDAFNKLTPAETERLALLSEELGEAQQAIGKILRHGYESYNPEVVESESNRRSLEKELGDVFAAVGLLFLSNDIDSFQITKWQRKKTEKVKQYLHHQE